MNINNLLAVCNMNLPYEIYTTNNFIISQAPYIRTCLDLETLVESKNDNIIVDDLQNQNLKILTENFEPRILKMDDNVLDNLLFGILVILAILMFTLVLRPYTILYKQ